MASATNRDGCLTSQKPIECSLPECYTALALITHSTSSSGSAICGLRASAGSSGGASRPGLGLGLGLSEPGRRWLPGAESLAAVSHSISFQINSLMNTVLCGDSAWATFPYILPLPLRLFISPESRVGCGVSPPGSNGPCLPTGASSPTPLAASSGPLPGRCACSESLCATRSDASFWANRGGLSSGPPKAQVRQDACTCAVGMLRIRGPLPPPSHREHPHLQGAPPPQCAGEELAVLSELPSHRARGGNAGIQTRAPYSKAGAPFTISHPCNRHPDGTTRGTPSWAGRHRPGNTQKPPGEAFLAIA